MAAFIEKRLTGFHGMLDDSIQQNRLAPHIYSPSTDSRSVEQVVHQTTKLLGLSASDG